MSTVEQYYDNNTSTFLKVGQSKESHNIHRLLWGEDVKTKEEAINYSNKLILDRVPKTKEPISILDLGCGVGATLEYLDKHSDQKLKLEGITVSMPVQIKWIDTRDDILSTAPPNGVEFICTDTPESEVDAAHPGAWFLVMTHDHALDQRLAEQVLKRDDFDYFGLIGSHAKRRNFETRMARRGIDPETFSRMTCPIGIEGLSSKQPAQIAISVAAEILQVYDRLQKTDNKNPPIYGLEVNP